MQFNLLKPPEGCLLDVDRIAGRSPLDKSVQVNQVFEQKRHLVSRISFAYKELEKRKRKQWYLQFSLYSAKSFEEPMILPPHEDLNSFLCCKKHEHVLQKKCLF